jgi:glycosyltransferase involved in cell wall biosynthesis
MKILYFSRGYTPHDFRFLSAIVEGGNEAIYLRLHPDFVTEKRRLPKGVRSVYGKLKNVISHEQPDLLHAGPLPDCGYQAAKSGFHPLVQMSWGSDILMDAKENAAVRSRVLFALKSADVVIADCLTVKRAAMNFGPSEKRIVTFPWGVDLSQFKSAGGDGGIRARLGWQKNFVLLHLRAWEPLYDPLTIARAFVSAAKKNANLRLLMPGSGSLSEKMHRIFIKGGVLGKVHLAGNVAYHDLPNYYRAADLYSSASLSDGSSVSLMEALACGLPALVSDIPSNREWVQSGKNGWLFPTRSEKNLEKNILKAAVSKRLKEIGRQARRTAKSKADWNKNKLALYKAYCLAMRSMS